jgi:Tripartite tricarboxylate transporter family receptor
MPFGCGTQFKQNSRRAWPASNSSLREIFGVRRVIEVTGWFGVLAPAGTPAPIVEQLNREINTILQAADVKACLTELGNEPLGGGSAEFGKLIATETALGRSDSAAWS